MPTCEVNIDDIRMDGGTQIRERIDEDTVADYATKMVDGEDFPACIVFHDGSDYWLADGFHRVLARKRANKEMVLCDIRKGTNRDAVLFACGANSMHGLRRSNADKRRAATTLLADPEWAKWDDSRIASQCGVGRNFIRQLREDFTCTQGASEPEPELRHYKDRYGNESVMDVSKIGKHSKQRPLTEDEVSLVRSVASPAIYVLGLKDRVKIGWSRYPLRRVGDLLTACPDGTVVAIASGTMAQERKVHNELECERDIGEWFVCNTEVAVEAMRSIGLAVSVRRSIGRKPAAASQPDNIDCKFCGELRPNDPGRCPWCKDEPKAEPVITDDAEPLVEDAAPLQIRPDPQTLIEPGGCTVDDLNTLVADGRKFACIYADPAWQYGNQATRASTDNHYPTMTVEQICALPVAQLAADDAHLHLWTTNGFLFEAKRVMEAWGFEYKSVMVWVKRQMGIGNYWRVSHEFLLLGVRGRCPFLNRGQMSWHAADRTTHSTKPEAFREKIELVSSGPRLELFGRKMTPGWTVWGNQISKTIFDVAEAV